MESDKPGDEAINVGGIKMDPDCRSQGEVPGFYTCFRTLGQPRTLSQRTRKELDFQDRVKKKANSKIRTPSGLFLRSRETIYDSLERVPVSQRKSCILFLVSLSLSSFVSPISPLDPRLSLTFLAFFCELRKVKSLISGLPQNSFRRPWNQRARRKRKKRSKSFLSSALHSPATISLISVRDTETQRRENFS